MASNTSTGSQIIKGLQKNRTVKAVAAGIRELKVSAIQLFKESVNIHEAMVSVFSSTGIAGFKFNIPKTEQIKMQSEVTDHYIDTNNAVQDHIARRPVTITLTGLQGDYFYSVNQIEDTLAKVVPTLALVKTFLPKLQAATEQIKAFEKPYKDKLAQLSLQKQQTNNPYVSNWDRLGTAWDTLNGQDLFTLMQQLYKLKSSQTRAFLFFEALWKSEGIFTVETTWRRYDYMVITDLTPVRDENADITEFSVTFKQINVTSSLVTNLNNKAGRTRQQLAQVNNKGVDKGTKTNV